MKSIFKLFLIVILFSSSVFAEGDMGTGGRTCPNAQTTCLVNTEPPQEEDTTTDSDSVLILIQEYFDTVIKYFGNQD